MQTNNQYIGKKLLETEKKKLRYSLNKRREF